MFAKCFSAIILLCSMMIGLSSQQVVIPSYASAYYTSPYAYPSVYSPYVATAYSPVWAWGSNKNKGAQAVDAPSSSGSLLNNQNPSV